MTQVRISEASRNLSHWINRATYGREPIILTSRGKAKAVLIGADTFETLIGMSHYAGRELMPLDQFRREFREALAEAGYSTRDELIELVRQVKQEIAAERAAAVEPLL